MPESIAQTLAILRGGLFGARWIEPEDYHVTLRFIGDIDAGVARDALFELSRVRKPAVSLIVDGLSIFGNDRPRAIVALIRPNLALAELQADHERTMRKVGLAPDTRKFTPHVTLAWLRRVKPASVAEYMSVRGYFPSREFAVDHFTVFSSRESTGGGPYVVEATYSLIARQVVANTTR